MERFGKNFKSIIYVSVILINSINVKKDFFVCFSVVNPPLRKFKNEKYNPTNLHGIR
jgi:hypothetical protein